jgi:hypothetical protein
MTWVRFLGYAAFSALGRVYQVVILDKILSMTLLATIEACFILQIFVIESYSSSAFAASASSTTLLSKQRSIR